MRLIAAAAAVAMLIGCSSSTSSAPSFEVAGADVRVGDEVDEETLEQAVEFDPPYRLRYVETVHAAEFGVQPVELPAVVALVPEHGPRLVAGPTVANPFGASLVGANPLSVTEYSHWIDDDWAYFDVTAVARLALLFDESQRPMPDFLAEQREGIWIKLDLSALRSPDLDRAPFQHLAADIAAIPEALVRAIEPRWVGPADRPAGGAAFEFDVSAAAVLQPLVGSRQRLVADAIAAYSELLDPNVLGIMSNDAFARIVANELWRTLVPARAVLDQHGRLVRFEIEVDIVELVADALYEQVARYGIEQSAFDDIRRELTVRWTAAVEIGFGDEPVVLGEGAPPPPPVEDIDLDLTPFLLAD